MRVLLTTGFPVNAQLRGPSSSSLHNVPIETRSCPACPRRCRPIPPSRRRCRWSGCSSSHRVGPRGVPLPHRCPTIGAVVTRLDISGFGGSDHDNARVLQSRDRALPPRDGRHTTRPRKPKMLNQLHEYTPQGRGRHRPASTARRPPQPRSSTSPTTPFSSRCASNG